MVIWVVPDKTFTLLHETSVNIAHVITRKQVKMNLLGNVKKNKH